MRLLTLEQFLGNYDLMSIVVAPLAEEIMKVAPVLILLLWGKGQSWKRILAPLDASILAGASGAGFAFVENLFRIADNNWASLGPDRVTYVASPQIGPFSLFPEMEASQYYGVPTVWFGHSEMAAFLALAIGMGLFFRKKTRAWWLIPGVTLIWCMWDHFLVNYLEPEPSQLWAKILPTLDLYGQLLPFIFLASIGLAIRTEKWYLSIDKSANFSISIAEFLKSLALITKIVR